MELCNSVRLVPGLHILRNRSRKQDQRKCCRRRLLEVRNRGYCLRMGLCLVLIYRIQQAKPELEMSDCGRGVNISFESG